MQNASSQATGEALPADTPTAPPHVDPGYALIRAIPPSAATLTHNLIMDMLERTAPRPPR
jgi:hypothetical protein